MLRISKSGLSTAGHTTIPPHVIEKYLVHACYMSSTVVSAGVPKPKISNSAFKVHSLMKELRVFVPNTNHLILSSAFILQHTILFSCPVILLMFFPLLQIFSPVFSMVSPRQKLLCLVSILKIRGKFSPQKKRPTSLRFAFGPLVWN